MSRALRRAAGAAAAAMVVASLWGLIGEGQTTGYRGRRTADGKPDLNGIWQVLNTAAWDIQDHTGSLGVPAGQGVVVGNDIPYKPEMLATKRANAESRFKPDAVTGLTADPESHCYLPGVPRATYMPYPFQVVQTPQQIAMVYEYARTSRLILTDGSKHEEGLDSWMGDARGRWEGDTLVVDSTDFNDQSWFDRAGNFHSDQLHVVERYAPIDQDHVNYEVTIEDPGVFTRPWKMTMPIYRRIDKNVQLLEYACLEYIEPLLYGHLIKK